MSVERFDRRAAGYDREWLQPRFFEPVREATLDIAAAARPEPAVVLDVGCGTGALLRHAGERFPFATLVGIDPSLGMIGEARAGGALVTQGRAEAIPFDPDTFDLVLSTLSLHHWADPALAVREIARVLAPGGAVVLADRRLPRRVDALLDACGLVSVDRRPVFSLGPLPIVTAVSALRPARSGTAARLRAVSTCEPRQGTRTRSPRPRGRSSRGPHA